MNESWISTALGEGWLLKVIAGVGIPLSATIAWFGKKPMEKAGILTVVNSAVQAQFTRFTEEITHLTERCERADTRSARAEERCDAAEESHENCQRELAKLWLEVKAQQIPPYINPARPGKRTKP